MRLCLRVVHLEAVADGLGGVVGSACFLASVQHALYKFFVLDLKTYYRIKRGAALLKHFVESHSLWDSAGEAVKITPFAAAGFVSSTSDSMLIIRSSGISWPSSI